MREEYDVHDEFNFEVTDMGERETTFETKLRSEVSSQGARCFIDLTKDGFRYKTIDDQAVVKKIFESVHFCDTLMRNMTYKTKVFLFKYDVTFQNTTTYTFYLFSLKALTDTDKEFLEDEIIGIVNELERSYSSKEKFEEFRIYLNEEIHKKQIGCTKID